MNRFLQAPLSISVVAGSLALVAWGCSGGSSSGGGASTPPTWTAHPNNPIIESGWTAAGDLLLNDPCVLFEGGSYHMWYSQGTGLGINHVKIYKATSADGLVWTHNPSVLLAPDSAVTVTGVTTPAVAGTFQLIGENIADFTNGKPAYKLQSANWYLWFDSVNSNYRVSDVLAGAGTASWLGTGGTIVDGSFAPYTGTASGSPAAASAWDSEKIETPMVVEVAGIYHLYYSGFKVGDLPARYQMGHATSTDGLNWTKDPNNPVVAYGTDPNQWGFYQVAEPGVFFNSRDASFYLYYTTAKTRGGVYSGTNLDLMQGIAVATSTDGSSFVFRQMALTQSAAYPVTSSFVGYSTPFPLRDSTGVYHLFYDVAKYPQQDDWRQVALAHATSTDGLTFTEIETDVFVFEDVGWRSHEVRAPSVLEEQGVFKMWFAGNNSLFFQPGFKYAIGFATSDKIAR